MKLTMKTAVKGLSLLAIAGGVLGGVAGAAYADGPTSPDVPYSPDPNGIGSIQFYDANGNAKTSGSTTDAVFASYAVASGTGVNNGGQDDVATLYVYTPVSGVLPANWQGNTQLTFSTTYPVTGAGVPASISGQPNATAAGEDIGLTLADAISFNPNAAAPGSSYEGLYEMRILTTRAGQSQDPNAYYAADIKVTGSTWTLINPAPAPATATTTTLTATPPSGADTTTSVTLSATATANSGAVAHPAGSIQFKDGATDLGTVAVDANGVASTTTTFSSAGSHSLTAVFTPTSSDFTASTGSLSYSVAGVATATTTALSANPQSGGSAFSPVALTATVAPANAAGSVKFMDGAATIGTVPVDTASGNAVLTYALFNEGSHNITATFLPTDPAAFDGSTSPVVTVVLGPPAGAAPSSSNVFATVNAGALTISTPYGPTSSPLDLGTLTPNAAGTMLSTSAQFGTSATPIQVTDTRAGNLPWTAYALSGAFDNGSGGQINAQNLGLTDLQYVLTPGNALSNANVNVYDNASAAGVGVADGGSLGLGGSTPHKIADAANGFGTIGFTGTMTLNAPTSTVAGVYNATVVFTVG